MNAPIIESASFCAYSGFTGGVFVAGATPEPAAISIAFSLIGLVASRRARR
jgi:hypothetical protein